MMARHLCALVRRQLVRRPEAEPAPMHVEHHWTLACEARCPNVQLQHVLALPAVVPVKEERLLDAGPSMQILRTVCSVHQGRILVRPRRGRLGWKPAILSGRGCAIRNTLERRTPPSTNPRTLPYCVFAIAERGVETLPGSW